MKLRQAIASKDIVARQKSLKSLTASQKQAALKQAMNSPQFLEKVGQAFIGPIMLRLTYEGVARNILLEDPLNNGELPYYDVGQFGKAYVLNDLDAEVPVTRFSGLRVLVDTFRIAAYPSVAKEDLFALRYNIIDHAREEAEQEILRKEDVRLFALIDDAIDDFASYDPNGDNHTIVMGDSTYTSSIAPSDVHAAIKVAATHELESTKWVMPQTGYADIMEWQIDNIGWKAREQLTDSGVLANYGPLAILKTSALNTQFSGLGDKHYILPDPQYIGWMPVKYSLDSEEWKQVPEFRAGWVLDEVIGQVIVNPAGLVKIE